MSTRKQHHASKERFWRRVIRQWQRSGLTAREFCKQHDLAEPSFYAWRRTIKQRDAARAAFVPVRVVPERREAQDRHDGSAGLELVVKGNRVLRIGPGFDEPTLRRLLILLEEGQS